MMDYLEKEEYCYLVMEYIKGKNLEEWIKEGKVFSPEEILKIGVETAGILNICITVRRLFFMGI